MSDLMYSQTSDTQINNNKNVHSKIQWSSEVWKQRLPNKVNNKSNTFRSKLRFKVLRLPLCLSGISDTVGEMTFDSTENNLKMSCLHLSECHTACYWAFPPALCFLLWNVAYWCTIWGCWYWEWLRWWVYTEQSLWYQEIIFPRRFRQLIMRHPLLKSIWSKTYSFIKS